MIKTWQSIDDIIEAHCKKFSLEPETIADWKANVRTIYAGHFFTFKDLLAPSKGGGRYHLIHVDDRANFTHVYDGYSRDYVEEVAGWLTTTGPFTYLSEILKAVGEHSNHFKSSSGFKSFFPDEVVYAGRFFIERTSQKAILYEGPTIQHYNVYGVSDDGRTVTKVGHFENDLPATKRYVKKITQYATKPGTTTDLGEPGNINTLIANTEHAIELAKKLTGSEN